MDLARTVRDRRKHLGLTQLDLAEIAGVSERFVRDVEAGKPSVQLDRVTALLYALGLELEIERRDSGKRAS